MSETEFHRPTDVESACRLLDERDDATVVAGNQSLGLLLKEGIASPDVLVDITGVEGLDRIERTDGELRVGALVTHRTVETSEVVAEAVPVLAEAAGRIADVQIRNAGTVGGATAYADPTADYPPVFVALSATIVTRSAEGGAEYAPGEFFTGYYESALAPNEIVTEVRLPETGENEGAAFEKLAFRENDRAIVNAAARLSFEDGTCTDASLGVAGVAERPYAVEAAAEELVDTAADDEAVEAAATAAREAVPVLPDQSISTEYREDMVAHLAGEALRGARERAGGSE